MFFALSSLFLFAGAVYAAPDSQSASAPKPAGPPKAAAQPVEENFHGTTIVDNYRWLEDGTSPATRKWVEAEMAYTRSLLDPLPGREQIHKRLTELLSIGSFRACTRFASRERDSAAGVLSRASHGSTCQTHASRTRSDRSTAHADYPRHQSARTRIRYRHHAKSGSTASGVDDRCFHRESHVRRSGQCKCSPAARPVERRCNWEPRSGRSGERERCTSSSSSWGRVIAASDDGRVGRRNRSGAASAISFRCRFTFWHGSGKSRYRPGWSDGCRFRGRSTIQ